MCRFNVRSSYIPQQWDASVVFSLFVTQTWLYGSWRRKGVPFWCWAMCSLHLHHLKSLSELAALCWLPCPSPCPWTRLFFILFVLLPLCALVKRGRGSLLFRLTGFWVTEVKYHLCSVLQLRSPLFFPLTSFPTFSLAQHTFQQSGAVYHLPLCCLWTSVCVCVCVYVFHTIKLTEYSSQILISVIPFLMLKWVN